MQDKKLRLALYFRNYGARTARNILIDIVPVIISDDSPSATVRFSPFPTGPTNPAIGGPDIPPGFPYTEYLTSSNVTFRESPGSEEMSVKLIGRMRYWDEFGPHCDTFSAVYDSDLKSFRLLAGYEVCDGKPHEILFCKSGPVLTELEVVEGSGLAVSCVKRKPPKTSPTNQQRDSKS